MNGSTNTIYNELFFDYLTERSLQSARVIVPILLNFINPKSVIDIGCGEGAWLRAFQECGVKTIYGLDGPYIVQSKLLIDPVNFRIVDLSHPFEIEGQYELAICLEVAEHLPAKAARSLIRTLTAAAPLVLFSAAIPGQGGAGHVNEQWPAYWKSLFAEYGFHRLDLVRPRVWQDSRVYCWYRQNIFLYASKDEIEKSTLLQAEEQRMRGSQIECIHESILHRYIGLRGILREVPRVALRTVKRRMSLLLSVDLR
jgi:SAM-dependent methyltransferase